MTWQAINESANREADVPSNVHVRCVDFLNALFFATNPIDIKVGIGIFVSSGEPSISMEFNNQIHAFTVKEARDLADLLQNGIHKFPSDAWVATLSDIILMIRHAAVTAEKEQANEASD